MPPEKIVMIPHGVPDLPFVETEPFKKELGLDGHFVLLSFGLLSPGKGFELVLEALPEVIRNHPDLLYIILGKTHPEVVKIHGERYRDSLQKLTHENKLENNMLFIDKLVVNLSNHKIIEHLYAQTGNLNAKYPGRNGSL